MSDSMDAAGPPSGRQSSGKRGRWVPGPESLAALLPSMLDSAKHAAAIEQAAAPLRAAHEAVARATAPFRKMAEESDRFHRRIMTGAGYVYEEVEDGPQPSGEPAEVPAPAAAPPSPAATADFSPAQQPAPPVPPASAQPPQRWEPPATTDESGLEGWALYERRDAPGWFVKRLREWWGPFQPHVPHHWIKLGNELEEYRRQLGTDPQTPAEFSETRNHWTPEELVKCMEGWGFIARKSRGRPHKRNVKQLDVNQWLAALFVADPEASKLSDNKLAETAKKQGCDWSARTIGTCRIRKQQRAMDLRQAEADHRAAADDLGEDLTASGLRLSTRKSGTGRQSRLKPADQAAERADREHDAAADAFIDNAEGKRRSLG